MPKQKQSKKRSVSTGLLFFIMIIICVALYFAVKYLLITIITLIAIFASFIAGLITSKRFRNWTLIKIGLRKKQEIIEARSMNHEALTDSDDLESLKQQVKKLELRVRINNLDSKISKNYPENEDKDLKHITTDKLWEEIRTRKDWKVK